MITLESRLHVDDLRGAEVVEFLLHCTDDAYRQWWPGMHLRLHTHARTASNIGNLVYMDEFVGRHHLKLTGVVTEVAPGRKIAWQVKQGIKLPIRLTLELDDDNRGVAITHTIQAGFQGIGRVLDPLFRLFFSTEFGRQMDEHVRTEFPRLRDLLRSAPTATQDV